jgi:acyl carrier protein
MNIARVNGGFPTVKNIIHNCILAQLPFVKEDQLTDKTAFMADLGADSLDLVEIGMRVEEYFDFQLTDDDTFLTVRDLEVLVERKLSAKRQVAVAQ